MYREAAQGLAQLLDHNNDVGIEVVIDLVETCILQGYINKAQAILAPYVVETISEELIKENLQLTVLHTLHYFLLPLETCKVQDAVTESCRLYRLSRFECSNNSDRRAQV